MYRKEGFTLREIAKMFNVSHNAIWKALKYGRKISKVETRLTEEKLSTFKVDLPKIKDDLTLVLEDIKKRHKLHRKVTTFHIEILERVLESLD